MTLFARLRSFLRAAFRRSRFERDMTSELEFHLDARVNDLMARGLERAAAVQVARRELGDPLRWKEEGREARGVHLIDQALADARYGIRFLARQPAFAFAAISTLALAVAANTTMFALTDAALFRPLPFDAPDRLVWVASVRTDSTGAPVTLPEFMDYRERTRTLAGLAAYAYWSASITGDDATERFQGVRISADAFDVLGMTPTAGRLLADADDRPDAPRVVVISHRLWQQRFGGAADIVGRQLRINGEPMAVAGVLPSAFPLPLRDIDVVAPLSPDRDPVRHRRSSTNFLRMFGRLGPGVSQEQARQELTAICVQLRNEYPRDYTRKVAIAVTPLADAIVGELGSTMVVLLVSVAVVLTTALANLLGLVLVKTNDRRAEVAVRVALGASRSRLTRQLVVEALALTSVAGVIGAGLGALATASVTAWAPASIPRLDEVRFDGRAALVVLALTFAATALLTLAPLGTIVRTRAHQALALVSRGSIGDRWNRRVRDGLIVAEISAALVLALAAMLVARDFARLRQVEPGFDPDAVFQARVSLPGTYQSPADMARFHDELMAELTQLPGVREAGLISSAPLSGVLATVPFAVVGQVDQESGRRPNTNYRVITPGYLSAAGTRLIRGRGFSDRDRAETTRVALVSQAFADRFIQGDPLGRQVEINDNNTGPRPVEIVGVVENVRHTTMSGPPGPDLYLPLAQTHPDGLGFLRNNLFWVVRSESGPDGLTASFVKALRAVDRDAAVSAMGTPRQGLEAWFAPRRFSLLMFGAFSLTTVLLAVSGLYGLVSYAVSQRRREIGLRMALGATDIDVRRLVLGHAARLAVAGLVLGIGVAFAARPVKAWLIGDTAVDPTLAVTTAAVLFAVVMLAGALPARRASRIDPTLALRNE